MENGMIQVKDENGNVNEATLLNIININNQAYALYALKKDDESSDLYASRIVEDKNGDKYFEDLKDNDEKSEIIKFIQETLKN